jgi:hypothetical protein
MRVFLAFSMVFLFGCAGYGVVQQAVSVSADEGELKIAVDRAVENLGMQTTARSHSSFLLYKAPLSPWDRAQERSSLFIGSNKIHHF